MQPAVLLVPLLSIAMASLAFPQEPPAQRPEPQAKTFSGNVVELNAEKVTVTRSILGGHAEKRTFLLKPETKIEGNLRLKAKVTVGYVATDEGDAARLIVVRAQRH